MPERTDSISIQRKLEDLDDARRELASRAVAYVGVRRDGASQLAIDSAYRKFITAIDAYEAAQERFMAERSARAEAAKAGRGVRHAQ